MSAPIDVHTLADELLQKASAEHSGRAGRTLPHPIDGLRQTVVALTAGAEMHEHESPGAASLLVIRGRVTVVADGESTEIGQHGIAPVPAQRHSLRADEQSVVLLSVALPVRSGDGDPAERRNVGG